MAQRYGGPLIFFLDEFDKVLTWHREDDTLLNALRASSIQGDSRYIVGGFREVMRAFSDLDSPLYNFARPVRLKEFSLRADGRHGPRPAGEARRAASSAVMTLSTASSTRPPASPT